MVRMSTNNNFWSSALQYLKNNTLKSAIKNKARGFFNQGKKDLELLPEQKTNLSTLIAGEILQVVYP